MSSNLRRVLEGISLMMGFMVLPLLSSPSINSKQPHVLDQALGFEEETRGRESRNEYEDPPPLPHPSSFVPQEERGTRGSDLAIIPHPSPLILHPEVASFILHPSSLVLAPPVDSRDSPLEPDGRVRIVFGRMRLLDRYLLRELLVPLGFCLGGFLVFWLAFDLFGELDGFQRAQMHFADVAEYYWFGLPALCGTVLPMGFLLALLYALTNHARHNELIAMRGAGISVWRICLPYLVLGLAFSLGLYGLNEHLAPDARERQENIRQRRVLTNAFETLVWRERIDLENTAEHRLWSIGAFHLVTSELRGPRVRMPLDLSARRALFARSALWTNGAWKATNVSERLWRSTDDARPAARTNRPFADFPQVPDSPDGILKWEGRDLSVPTALLASNPGAPAAVLIQTNVLWRTNLVVPPDDGRRWRIGSLDPIRGELHDLRVEVPLEAGGSRLIIGESGRWEDDHWVFQQVTEYLFRGFKDDEPMRVTHAELALPELTETPEMIRADIRVHSQRRGKALHGAELTLREIRDYERLHRRISPELTASLDTQLHARLAAPWTCLVVVLIAIPFSVPSGRRNVFYGVAGSIGIAFAYLVLQRFGFALGQSGQVPGWVAAWLPNAVFALTGIILISRVR